MLNGCVNGRFRNSEECVWSNAATSGSPARFTLTSPSVSIQSLFIKQFLNHLGRCYLVIKKSLGYLEKKVILGFVLLVFHLLSFNKAMVLIDLNI